MRVSIIIPTFNRARFLERALFSVINQTHSDWECLIVDDGSTDCSAEICQKWMTKDKRFHYLPSPSNKGAQNARNRGIQAATGHLVQFLDSDDELHEAKFKVQIEAFSQANKEYSGIVGLTIEKGPDFETPRPNYPSMVVSFSDFASTIGWHTLSPLWKIEAVRKIYPLPEDLQCYQDWDWANKILASCGPVLALNVLVGTYHRHGDDSITASQSWLAKRDSRVTARVIQADIALRQKQTSAFAYSCILGNLRQETPTFNRPLSARLHYWKLRIHYELICQKRRYLRLLQ